MKRPFYHVFRHKWMRLVGVLLPPLLVGIVTYRDMCIHPCPQGHSIFGLIFIPFVCAALAFVPSLCTVDMFLGWIHEDY